MALSTQQALWLARALDHRDADGGLLGTAELQLMARYIELGGEDGRSAASNAELVTGLSSRQTGRAAGRKAFSGASGARRSLEQRSLIRCTRAVRSKRHPRTGARTLTPWQVTITADCEQTRPFAWTDAAAWIGRMLDERALPSHARQIALRLARALDATGQLAATRSELELLLDVQRGTALRGLRLLETCGLLSFREDRSRRPAVLTISARSEPVTATTPVAPRQLAAAAPLARARVSAVAAEPVVADAVIEFEASGQAVLLVAAPATATATVAVAVVPPPVEPVRLAIAESDYNPQWIAMLRATCQEHRGETPVMLVCPDGVERPLKSGPGGDPITVAATDAFVFALSDLQTQRDEDDNDGFLLACEDALSVRLSAAA